MTTPMISQDSGAAATYRLADVPGCVTAMRPGTALTSDTIDYAAHPAYAGYTNAGMGERAVAIATYLGKFAVLAAKRLIRYEMIPRSLRSPRSMADRLKFARVAARHALGRRDRAAAIYWDEPVIRQLADHGIAVLQMPADRFRVLNSLAQSHFARLAARRGDKSAGREFEESRGAADPRDDRELYEFLRRMLQESGILNAASAYAGRTVDLIDVNPQINDKSDTFWEDIFPDRNGEKLPRTAYFHRDASGGDLKVIVYCSDVGCDNGPFTYAVGSNGIAISRMDDLLREANDHNGLSGTEPENRRRFAALPKRWQQKGSFGNDLADDTPLSRAIVDSAWDVEGPAGSIVLFDTKGIHRGGMVRSGERRVITCVLG